MADETAILDAVVIGAGTAGLSAAHALRESGISFILLDRGARVGESWRKRHPRLTMNTYRDLSTLPDTRFPAGTRSFATRDELVRHMEDFLENQQIEIRHGTVVGRISRSDGHYRVETNGQPLLARHVIVATGRDRSPVVPEWAGRDAFTGELVHSSAFLDAAEYEGKSILVVGAGNSGFDVLNHLVRVKTGPLWLSVRRSPAVLPRRLFGLTVHRLSPLLAKMPVGIVDRLLSLSQRAAFGDLARLGFPREAAGGASRLRDEQVALVVDEGTIAGVARGRISLVPEVKRFCGGSVVLADDSRVSPDIVIAATGYTPGLGDMLEGFDLLDRRGFPTINGGEQHPKFPGLWFIGMRASLLGDVGSAKKQAKAIARGIAATLSR